MSLYESRISHLSPLLLKMDNLFQFCFLTLSSGLIYHARPQTISPKKPQACSHNAHLSVVILVKKQTETSIQDTYCWKFSRTLFTNRTTDRYNKSIIYFTNIGHRYSTVPCIGIVMNAQMLKSFKFKHLCISDF